MERPQRESTEENGPESLPGPSNGNGKEISRNDGAVHLTSVAGNLDPAPVHQSGIWSTLAFPSFLWANYRQRRRTAILEFQSQLHPRSRQNERNTPARTYHHGDFGCSD